ncbi:uncharacterized protein LOC135709605 [Ochlerotatus camptorhynchus]|uniref:uncharacterized protein LOC135709605 n=1 Tax=Ochlerotatus camptorhynchus TaxID=644619 RepID=UPI0031D4272A
MDEIQKHQAEFEGNFAPLKGTLLKLRKRQNPCENCLKQHSGEPCQSGNCRKCNLPHHTRMHEALQSTAASTTGNSTVATTNIYGSSSMSQTHLCRATDFMDTNVLLLTATINVFDKFGRPHACRAVLACASHTSYITEDLWSIQLADPQFHHPGKVSILLGNKLFFQLLEPGRNNLGLDDYLPVLQNTKLGWVVSGGYKDCDNQPHTNAPSCLLTTPNDPLSDQLRKFWELEEYTNKSPHFNDEEIRCEEHFTKHTIRNSTGKFIVRLPYLDSPTSLGKSREIAEKRLLHLERKLERNLNLKQQYHSFMREYIDLGHMSLATTPVSENCVFLPHHCVVKEDSSTTKCRVVFDASAKTSSGKSLNDILLAGPVLQDSLVNILLRFRFPPVVLAGDVKHRYRMVLLYDEDRNCIRILWRWSEDKPIQEYCLNTVTYGTKSASYLATKCVQQLLLSHQGQFSDAVEKAIKGIYVDDLLTGADSADEAKQLRQELSIIFSAGGFHLRKWASNSNEALEGVPEADLEMKIPIELNEPNTIKALGIHWQPCSDEFLFNVQPPKILQPTKRIILSNIASLFDPLGLLAPIIIKAKLLMQHLWELTGLDWDVIPPGELTNIWQVFVQGLAFLNSFQVPRRVIGTNRTSRIFLHGYSDASERAMGACIYIRAIDDAGNNSSHLLCAKSKVAPIGNKRTTLLRLELCAAVILARLINNVTSAINQPFFEIRAWVDSSVVLAWLNDGASRWKTFVANRVA